MLFAFSANSCFATITRLLPDLLTVTVAISPGVKVSGNCTENISLPFNPKVSAFSPSENCRGMIPIPTKLER